MDSDSKHSWMNLYQKDSEKAWEIFTQKYNPLIFGVINKSCHDHDEVMEIYTFVLEHLKAKDCKRLTSYFQKERNYNFDAWIVVVTRNCVFDWFRKEKGRKRLLKSIESLPEIDRRIFEYIYQHRYSYSETYEILKSKHGLNFSFEEMCSHAQEINNNLQRKTKWRIIDEWQSVLPPIPLESIESGRLKLNLKNSNFQDSNSPEENLIKSDISKIINDALNKLAIQDRLIVELHLYRGLTLKEISGIIKEKKIWRIRRKLKKALQLMRNAIKEKGISSADFDIF